jgi:hypothetical protein
LWKAIKMGTRQKAAVISADVISSSTITPTAHKKLQAELDSFQRQALKQWPDFKMQQYRGDSLQGTLTANRLAALRVALLLQSDLVKEKFGIRISIGIGEISYRGKDIITSDGSAFRASGPFLDVLRKTGEVISIAGADTDFTSEWQAHSASLNYIIQHWTPQQAEAVHLQLQGYTQEKIARKLKIKQPSVHQRLQGAGWTVIQKILQRFESL